MIRFIFTYAILTSVVALQAQAERSHAEPSQYDDDSDRQFGGGIGGLSLGGGGATYQKRDTSNDGKALEDLKKNMSELSKTTSQNIKQNQDALDKQIKQAYDLKENTDGIKQVQEFVQKFADSGADKKDSSTEAPDRLVKEIEQFSKQRVEAVNALIKTARQTAAEADAKPTPAPAAEGVAASGSSPSRSGLGGGTQGRVGSAARQPASLVGTGQSSETYNDPFDDHH